MPLLDEDVYYNNYGIDKCYVPTQDYGAILRFHQQLSNYKATPLVDCPELADQLRVQRVFVKNESSRFGLPAFKILGASWGCFKAIIERLSRLHCPPKVSIESSLETIVYHLSQRLPMLTLYAATDGNHGRAVAYMARILGIRARIYVPCSLDEGPKVFIRAEGAEVYTHPGNYDQTVEEARRQAAGPEGMFIQDTALEGYEQIPRWIVHGYLTMLIEADEQIRNVTCGHKADIIIVPIGVGSLGTTVVCHYRTLDRWGRIIAVEPKTADCLFQAFVRGKPRPIETGHTIMEGMNCGTVSPLAWPHLKAGVHLSVRVSDHEAHEAVQDLWNQGILAGPCGSAPLAALKSLCGKSLYEDVGITPLSRVLLLCTEGARDYSIRPSTHL